jgi:hypothetical protein
MRAPASVLLGKKILITLATTGGGARTQGLLWDPPGASAFLGGARFTYATEESDELVGFQLDKYASPEAAMHLAMACYARSCETLELRMRRRETDYANARSFTAMTDTPATELDWMIAEDIAKLGAVMPIGVGLAAHVASRYSPRLHVVVVTPTTCQISTVELPGGASEQERAVNGAICDTAALNAILVAVGEQQVLEGHGRILEPQDVPQEKLRELILQRPYFAASGQRLEHVSTGSSYNLVPVTANPLHEGHVGMAEAVEARTGVRSVFVLTACAPPSNGTYEKPAPTAQDLLRRVAMVRASNRLYGAERGVYLSSTALFVDMAKQHLGSAIVVGADALQRALDPQWLGSVEATLVAFNWARSCGTIFYTFDRDPVFAEDVRSQAVQMFGQRMALGFIKPIPASWPISSTALRELRGWSPPRAKAA